MDTCVYLQKTLSAQFATAYAPVRSLWNKETLAYSVALYYKRHGLRVRWDTNKRTLIIDLHR